VSHLDEGPGWLLALEVRSTFHYGIRTSILGLELKGAFAPEPQPSKPRTSITRNRLDNTPYRETDKEEEKEIEAPGVAGSAIDRTGRIKFLPTSKPAIADFNWSCSLRSVLRA
jgi:hypothetical protein